MNRKVVLAFGTFDGLHDGHRHFLREAKKLGDYLVAVVAHDDAVRKLKKREPRISMEERAVSIKKAGLADEVVIGDQKQGSWGALKAHKPDVIALGHDQHALGEALEKSVLAKDVLLINISVMPRK